MTRKGEIFGYIILALWLGYLVGNYVSIKSDWLLVVGILFIVLAILGAYFSSNESKHKN